MGDKGKTGEKGGTPDGWVGAGGLRPLEKRH